MFDISHLPPMLKKSDITRAWISQDSSNLMFLIGQLVDDYHPTEALQNGIHEWYLDNGTRIRAFVERGTLVRTDYAPKVCWIPILGYSLKVVDAQGRWVDGRLCSPMPD